jgi:hypothetical protein
MTISQNERDVLIENAIFFTNKDYAIETDDYSVSFNNGVNIIQVGFAPNSDISEVSIKFIKENIYFNIAWIAVVRDNLIVNCNEKLNGAIQLLKYLEENYEKITNYEYCIESRKLVSEYIKKMDE